MSEKELIFLGSSLEDMKQFSVGARRESGFQLGRVQSNRVQSNRVQSNKEPSDWKPFLSIGAGVKEIRIKKDGAYCIMYVTKFKECMCCMLLRRKTKKYVKRILR